MKAKHSAHELPWSPWEPVDFSAARPRARNRQSAPPGQAHTPTPEADTASATTAAATTAAESAEQLTQSSEQAHNQGYEAGYQEGLAAGHAEGQVLGHQDGYAAGQEEGRLQGYNQGLEEGRALAQEAGQRLSALTRQFEAALSSLDQRVADELLSLALEVARQMVQQAIRVKPELLLPTLRQALAELPHPQATIVLHPDDAQLVREYLGEQLSASGHRLQEDPHMARGGCLLETQGSELDATLSTRWHNIVANLGRDLSWLAGADDADDHDV